MSMDENISKENDNDESEYNNAEKIFDDNLESPIIIEVEMRIYDKASHKWVFRRVSLQKIPYRKPMLGGLVNKKIGTYFYHAYSQTDQYKNNPVPKDERDTQTYEYVTRSTKTHREFGTQMERIGLYIDTREDLALEPTEYETAKRWQEHKEQTVEYLQKRMRGFLSRKLARKYRDEKEKKRKEQLKAEENQRIKEEKENKNEIKRRMHPKTKKDFILLRGELDSWVKNETMKIKASSLSPEDQTLALQELLHKEISLLETIEKLKISADKEKKAEKIENFLDQMSADKKFTRWDGRAILVSTVSTQLAEKLKIQFKNLNSTTSMKSRYENLQEFKKLILTFKPCTLINNIINLIERESQMLSRGRPDSSLEGLRQRLNNLYLNFIEIPSFNFEAAKGQKIPRDWLMDLYKPYK